MTEELFGLILVGMAGGIEPERFDSIVERIEKAQDKAATNKQPGPRYTVILWDAVRQLDLTIEQYVLADSIHKLSTAHSPVPGWCYASKETLAGILGVARATLFRHLKALQEKGLVEGHSTHKNLLRTTKRWHSTVEVIRTRAFNR